MKKKNDQLSKDESERRSCWWMSLSDSERSLRRNALINQLNEATHALVAAGEVSPDEASQLLWLDEDRLYVAPYTDALHSNVPALKALLEKQEAGPVVADRHKFERLLAACWHEFEGSEAEQMDWEELLGRTEEPMWQPPLLQFSVERHGETVMGSKMAIIQRWHLDLEALTAEVYQEARR
jgi:hypothetical protein